MARLVLSEVFAQLKKLTKNAEKTELLRKYAGLPLFYLLFLAFSDRIKWLLPDGAPPYKPYGEAHPKARPGAEPSDLLRELRRLYIFLDGSGNHINQLIREKRFQELLESMDKEDVALLLAVKDKRLDKDYKLSRKLLDETFPGILDAPIKNRFLVQ